MSLKSLKNYDATRSYRQGNSRKGDRHANRKQKPATGPTVSGIEIIRERSIQHLRSKGYGKFRIIWHIYMHEKRCHLCQRMIELRDNREAFPLGVTTR